MKTVYPPQMQFAGGGGVLQDITDPNQSYPGKLAHGKHLFITQESSKDFRTPAHPRSLTTAFPAAYRNKWIKDSDDEQDEG